MKRVRKSLFTLAVLSLGGCSSMSSDFSCNVTAGDSCLTIEQVDAMTRFADETGIHKRRKQVMKAKNTHHGRIVKQGNGSAIWVSQGIKEESWEKS